MIVQYTSGAFDKKMNIDILKSLNESGSLHHTSFDYLQKLIKRSTRSREVNFIFQHNLRRSAQLSVGDERGDSCWLWNRWSMNTM